MNAGTPRAPQIIGALPQGYAGEVSADEAFRILAEMPDAQLVDVRTMAEWSFVGLADLSAAGKEPLLAEWQSFPAMGLNPSFVEDVSQALGTGKRDAPILFLCRSGVRSRAAAIAMTAQGFSQCYNIAGGFEGDVDESGHRGQRNGWKASGLPWNQR